MKSMLSLSIGAVAVQMTGRLHEATGNFNSLFIVLAVAAAIVLITTVILIPSKRPEAVPA